MVVKLRSDVIGRQIQCQLVCLASIDVGDLNRITVAAWMDCGDVG